MPLIKDSVESVLKQGVEIIAVDGRFRDFPSKENFSTDGTYEYLEEIGAKIIGVPNLTEIEKRNLLFSMTSVGDTVLVLDADECVHGTIPELKADIGIVALLEDSHGVRATFTLHNRFFNVEAGLKYEKLHHRIVNPNGSLFCSADECGANSEIVKSFYLTHHRTKRPLIRQEDKETYYEKLREDENGRIQQDSTV